MMNIFNNLLEYSLHPVVTLINRIPTYDTLMDRIYQMQYNAVSTQMILGGGKLGFLALTVLPTM